jgi:hypothetical protein
MSHGEVQSYAAVRRYDSPFGFRGLQAARPQEDADGPEPVLAEILINPDVGSAGDDGRQGERRIRGSCDPDWTNRTLGIGLPTNIPRWFQTVHVT